MNSLKAIVLVFGCLSCVLAAHHQLDGRLTLSELTSRVYESQIIATLECLKQTLIQGDPENGIPSFNPFKLDKFPISLSNNFVQGNIQLSNLLLAGVPDFEITQLKFSIIGFKVNFMVEFKKITFDTGYDGNLDVFDFIPLFGKGNMNVGVEKLEIGGSFRIVISKDGDHTKLSIANLQMSLGLSDFKFAITGLLNDEDVSLLLSEVITDTVKEFICTKQAWLTDNMSPVIQDFINSKIGDLSLESIIGGKGLNLEGCELSRKFY